MPTPAIQTLVTDAQQVLNLSSISAVRATVAVALANANTGTPLNPNLTTQQLWDQFYQVVTQPKSDIESIIANQLMKFLYAPPAPGGVGADKQVIFNDGGTLAGDADFIWNKATNLLTVTGSATITGDLTVDTNVLKVDSANNRVGINFTSPTVPLYVQGSNATATAIMQDETNGAKLRLLANSINFDLSNGGGGGDIAVSGANPLTFRINGSEQMRLNSTGLGVGASPSYKLHVAGANPTAAINSTTATSSSISTLLYRNLDGNSNAYSVASIAGETAGNGGYGNLIFSTGFNGSLVERMRIDLSGNLGLGVTPAAAVVNNRKLEIAGDINSAVVLGSKSANASARNWATASNWNAYGDLVFLQSNAVGGDPLAAGTTRMTLNSNGALVLQGGTAAANGVGIAFPATQSASSDAKTLDDYEEGTWTPTIAAETGTIGSTSIISANYTKIGRLVSVTFDIRVITAGTGSGGLKVSLPFSPSLGGQTCGAGREYINTGNMLQISKYDATNVLVYFYNNTTMIADNNRVMAGYTYFI